MGQLIDKNEFLEDYHKSFASLKEGLLQLGDSISQEILDTGLNDKDSIARLIEEAVHSLLEEVANEHESE